MSVFFSENRTDVRPVQGQARDYGYDQKEKQGMLDSGKKKGN